MLKKTLAAGLLAMLLAAPGAQAQATATGAAQPAANLVDPGAIQALKDMGAHLQALKRFRVSTDLTGERVLADGQKLQHSATADLDVERPNKVRVHMASARSERQLFYDGKNVTPTRQRRSTTRRFRSAERSVNWPKGSRKSIRSSSTVRPVRMGYAGRTTRQDRVRDECGPGFCRRRSM